MKLEARVISLLPAATEIALCVGGESALVGLSHLCAQPAGRELPRVLSTPVDSERWSMAEIDRYVRDASARNPKPAPRVAMSSGSRSAPLSSP